MNKNQPSEPATHKIAGALFDVVMRAAMSRDPNERIAGRLILAGLFIAYLVVTDDQALTAFVPSIEAPI